MPHDVFPCRRAERSVFEGLRGCVSSEGLWRKPAALLQAPGSSVAELLKRQPLGLGKACSCELAVVTEGCNPRADSGRARCRSWAGGLAAVRQRRTAPPLLPPRLLLLLLLSLPLLLPLHRLLNGASCLPAAEKCLWEPCSRAFPRYSAAPLTAVFSHRVAELLRCLNGQCPRTLESDSRVAGMLYGCGSHLASGPGQANVSLPHNKCVT